jgi:DNA-binding transcriptional MocR family regulator
MLTIGSLSKLFWGGLRVGWVRGPTSVIGRLAQLKTVLDLGTSIIGEAVAVQVLSRGEELSERRRTLIQRRADLLMTLLRRGLPEWTFDEPAGGLSLWVRVPGVDTAEFAQHSLRSGVAIVPGAICSPNATFSDHVRLPFTNREEELARGVDRLVGAWRTFRPRAAAATTIVG